MAEDDQTDRQETDNTPDEAEPSETGDEADSGTTDDSKETSEENIFEDPTSHVENTLEGEEPDWWWILTLFGIFTASFYGAIVIMLVLY